MSRWFSNTIVLGGTNYLGFFDSSSGKLKNSNITSQYVNLYGMRYIPPFLALGFDKNVVVFNLETKKKVLDGLTSSYVWGIDRLKRDRFITAGGIGHVGLWSLQKRLKEFKGHTTTTRECASVISTGGEYFCSVGNDGKLVVYNSRKGIEKSISVGGQIYGVMEDYYVRQLYICGYNSGSIYTYDLRQKPSGNLPSYRVKNNLWCLYVSSEERKIFTGDSLGNVCLIDSRKCSSSVAHIVKESKIHNAAIYRVKRMNHKFMVTCSSARMCSIFSKDTLKEKKKISPARNLYGLEVIPSSDSQCFTGEIGIEATFLGHLDRLVHESELQRLQLYQEFSRTSKQFEEGQVMVTTVNKIRIPIWKCFLLSKKGQKKSDVVIKDDLEKMNEIKLPKSLDIDKDVVQKSLCLTKFNYSNILDRSTLLKQKKRMKKESGIFFPLSKLDDYYHFFRHLGLKSCMIRVIKELQSMRNLELIVYLFIQSVRKYESEENQMIFQQQYFISQVTKEEEGRSIFQDLEKEVEKADEKLKEKRKMKAELMKKIESGEKNYDEDFYESDEEYEDDERSPSSEPIKIRFMTCFSQECFNLIKMGEHEIYQKSELLKLCLPFLQHIESYDPECNFLENHPDFKDFFNYIESRQRPVYSLRSLFSGRKVEEEDEEEDEKNYIQARNSSVRIPQNELMETQKIVYETRKFWNVEVMSNDRKKFKCHLEVLVLRSPFFSGVLAATKGNDMKINAKVVELIIEEGRVKTIICHQLSQGEMEPLIEYVYLNRITEKTIKSQENLKYILKLMIFSMLNKENNLMDRCYRFLFRYFRKRRKSDFESFLINYGHLLEDENLQTRFVREMARSVVFNNGKVVDETMVEDQLQKSVRKFKVESVLKFLKRECGVVERENEKLKREKALLLKKLKKTLEN